MQCRDVARRRAECAGYTKLQTSRMRHTAAMGLAAHLQAEALKEQGRLSVCLHQDGMQDSNRQGLPWDSQGLIAPSPAQPIPVLHHLGAGQYCLACRPTDCMRTCRGQIPGQFNGRLHEDSQASEAKTSKSIYGQ